jgi:hypothetical protein
MRHARAGATLCAGALALACSAVQAQAVVVGTYKGAVERPNTTVRANPRPRMMYVELEIARVDGDKIAGTWVHLNGRCRGRTPVDGMLRGGRLIIEKHPAPGQELCGPPKLGFAIEGEALVGPFAGGIRMTR